MAKETLIYLTNELKKLNQFPKNMELAKIGSVHISTAFDEVSDNVISGRATTGLSTDPYLSSVKALTELIERKAFVEDRINNKNNTCKNSDGFAAFPNNQRGSEKIARENALNEAIERYVWAKWWDNFNYKHENLELSDFSGQLNYSTKSLLKKVNDSTPIKEMFLVKPSFNGAIDKSLFIFFCFTRSGGVISGGACGNKNEPSKIIFRALSELVRHSITIKNSNDNDQGTSFYEKRLLFFGKKQINDENLNLVKKRVFYKNDKQSVIELPELEIDDVIEHNLDHIASVHRCYFRNQPVFVGGDLKRLCL